MTFISYNRQDKIFNPANQRFKIVVFGAGSIGSFVTLNLAKLGFEDITVYDFDKIENYNIPNQFYKLDSVGKYKLDALKEVVKEFTGVDIKIKNEKFTEDSILPVSLDTLYVLTFDNLESRKLVYDKLRGYSNYLLDCRMGGETYEIITSLMNNDKDLEEHDKYFKLIPTDLECGMKAVIYNILSVSAEICNIVKKLNESQEYPKSFVRHMKRNFILTDRK